jgi:hypothetical protein
VGEFRAALVASISLAACTPDVATRTYDCGPEQLCPPGQRCNGPDNTCVTAGTEQAFACDPTALHEPDDMPAQGNPLPALHCPSAPFMATGCLAAGDIANWSLVQAPTGCPPIALAVRVEYPIAFEQVGFEVWDLGGAAPAKLAASGACDPGPLASGDTDTCATTKIASGGSYGILAQPAGGDCKGACAFNRYELTVQIVASP